MIYTTIRNKNKIDFNAVHAITKKVAYQKIMQSIISKTTILFLFCPFYMINNWLWCILSLRRKMFMLKYAYLYDLFPLQASLMWLQFMYDAIFSNYLTQVCTGFNLSIQDKTCCKFLSLRKGICLFCWVF